MFTKKTVKQIVLTALAVTIMVVMGACNVACPKDEPEPTDAFPPEGYEVGKSYLVDAAAWHESEDHASMMADLLYDKAYVSVMDDHIDVTMYFIHGAIFNIPVSPDEIKDIKYLGGDEYADVERSYDKAADVLSVKFSLDDLSEYTTLKMEFSGEKTLRLKLDVSSNVEASSEPDFPFVEREYLVPVVAWHATNDVPSMMAPLVYEYAYVKVFSESITLCVYFITGQIQPPMPPGAALITIDVTAITAFKYKDIDDDAFTDVLLRYDVTAGVKRAQLMLSTTDLSSLGMIESQVTYLNGTNPSTASLRLVLDIDLAEVTTSEPVF
ncbi:MAG: hypothetical protein FWF98_01440 [Dehalococcoidia bacterium]|nr:hypothetical protein [Dehalococcoidia bacterium]